MCFQNLQGKSSIPRICRWVKTYAVIKKEMELLREQQIQMIVEGTKTVFEFYGVDNFQHFEVFHSMHLYVLHMLVYNIFTVVKILCLACYSVCYRPQKPTIKIFFLFTEHMYVFGFEQLLLSCIMGGCDSICSPCFKLYLGSIGSGVFKKTSRPVVVVFVYLSLLSHDSTKLYLYIL